MPSTWPTRTRAITQLHLDSKNPRLGRETTAAAPRELIQYLFDHDQAIEIAESIATCGYFPNEPLLAIEEEGRTVVVEGNRRLAALKALAKPGLLEGPIRTQVERYSRRLIDPQLIASVPVTLAPSRRETDRQIAQRHVRRAVRSWVAENRASFILDKLEEGYSTDELRDDLRFSLADIQDARLTRAVADMARSLNVPEEIKARIDNPRPTLFSTIKRVFESEPGRRHLMVEAHSEHGLQGTTTKKEFLRGFTRLVTDLALGNESSRSLNKADDIDGYFTKRIAPEDLPQKKRGSFVPADLIEGKSVASKLESKPEPKKKPQPSPMKTVLPRTFKVRYGPERLRDIRDELCKLKRAEFPNASAVLLRVFFELAALDYLGRTGDLGKLKTILEKKNKLRFGVPQLSDLRQTLVDVAKRDLDPASANAVEKAIKKDAASPFGLDSLHAFVHDARELPGENDIRQFWTRTEPLFRLMLEEPTDADA